MNKPLFKDITLEWRGNEFVIPHNKVMKAIAIVENVITLHELMGFETRGTMPMAKLAMAYSALLSYAGADATEEDVYSAMFVGKGLGAIREAITSLVLLMAPPSAVMASVASPVDGGTPSGNRKSRRAVASSKRRTKRQSAGDGSNHPSSGA